MGRVSSWFPLECRAQCRGLSAQIAYWEHNPVSGGGEGGGAEDTTWSMPQMLDPEGPAEESTDMQLSTVHLGRQNGDVVTCRH